MENEYNRRTIEAELVRRVQSGDQEAFRDLVERHQNKIFIGDLSNFAES